MEKLQFKTVINAPREKVWDVITDENSYKEWTKIFEPTSHFEGEWKAGSKMLFLGIDENGVKSGMLSEIAEARHPEFISIKHLGEINKGVEEPKDWAPAYENYTLTEVDGGTELVVDQDMLEEYVEMFERLWPQALEKLKELSES